MQITITGRRMEMTDALKEYVQKKIHKLDKYLENILEIRVTLSVEKYRHIAEISVHGQGLVLNAEEWTGDMYSSIDKVMDTLERQIRKHKGRIVSKKQKQNSRANNTAPMPETVKPELPKVIRSEKFAAKPMSLEEAVMQMNMGNEAFLAFRNSANEEVNVLYRRKDGNFGLIEPH